MVDVKMVGGAGVFALLCLCCLGFCLRRRRSNKLGKRRAASVTQYKRDLEMPAPKAGGRAGIHEPKPIGVSTYKPKRTQQKNGEKGIRPQLGDFVPIASSSHVKQGSDEVAIASVHGFKRRNSVDLPQAGLLVHQSPAGKPVSPRRKPKSAATAGSGDIGMFRDMAAIGDQPETPPSTDKKQPLFHPSPKAKAHAAMFASPKAKAKTKSPKAMSSKPKSPRAKRSFSPGTGGIQPKPFSSKPAPPSSPPPDGSGSQSAVMKRAATFGPTKKSMKKSSSKGTLKKQQTTTAVAQPSLASKRSRGFSGGYAPKAQPMKPIDGFKTASGIQAGDKDSTLMDCTIGELRTLTHNAKAKHLSSVLGSFPDSMVVSVAMKKMTEGTSTSSPSPSSPRTRPRPGSLMPTIDPAEKAAAMAEFGGLDPGVQAAIDKAAGSAAYRKPRAATLTGAQPKFSPPPPSDPLPHPHPHGGRGHHSKGRRAPPTLKARGDSRAHTERHAHPRRGTGGMKPKFPMRPAEPVPEPFRAPSQITQDYIDGYDSDESMYSPQFGKRSARRLSLGDSASTRAFQAVAAGRRGAPPRGHARGESKRRLRAAGRRKVGLDKSGELTEKEFYEKYWIEAGKLGEGSFARVRKITRKIDRMPFALKVVKKAGKTKEDLKALQMEIDILSKISQKNVVGLTDWVYTKKRIYMVVEYCSGGDVFERILAQKTFSESDAAGVVRQVLCGLEHIHARHIVHRDLKPDNLMYATAEVGAEVKIIDFGLAGDCSKKPLTTPCGTAHYAAPEVLSGKPYGTQADMWSLGVIVYMLLCGFPPFFDATGNTKRLYKLIKSGRYRFPSPYWDGITDSAKDFIRALLEKDVHSRMTALEALSHPWVGGSATTEDMSTLALEQLKQVASSRLFTMKVRDEEDDERPAAASGAAPVKLFARPEYAVDFHSHDY